MLFIGIVLFIAAAFACQRDFNTPKRHTHRPPIKKRNVDWPPVLDSDEESIIVNSFDNVTVDEWSYYYGHQNKLAGHGREAAEWTRERWSENGFDAHLSEYHVYLSYPVSQSVKVTYEDGHTEDIKIQEDALPEDDVTGREDSLPTFHGYSASGHVTAEYVYVGLGSIAEYERLQELGVEVEGKIALVKYGGLFRGLKVKNAQDHGMIGVIIFTDPDGDGEYTVANGYEHYPDGPARHPDSVQKGSVLFLSTRPGDPTTPGYASHEDVPRASVEDVVPKIPSLPISYAAALPILKALDGYGTAAEEVNRTGWVGALEAEYATGPAPGVTISLENIMEERITPIWNVIGTINGTNSDETIVVGNHRDTWMIGGNGDPNSGSAILVELSKVLKKLTDSGWKPKRNIVFASWDGEEYGMLGSTEWVEDHAEWLTETAVAYLNIDVAVSGPNPSLELTPELKNIGTDIMKKVIHPAGGAFNETLFDAWYRLTEGEVGPLGSGSDYTSFLHYGINSLDVGSGGASGDPVWHYHSNYDTYHWMSTYGDPGFSHHATMGQYLGLLLYHLSSDQVLPIDVVTYGSELEGLYDDLVEFLEGYDADLDLDELKDAVGTFKSSASEAKTLEMLAVESQNEELIQVVNHKYRDFQRGFVSQGGLPGREFYKHVVTAPGLDTGYAPVTYPGITEGVQYGDGNYTVAQEWVSKTARGIVRAAEILKT